MHRDKPSATALLIARSQLLLAEDPRLADFVDPRRADIYRRFVEAADGAPWRPGVGAWWLRFIERISIPGIYLHYALRKRRIEEFSRAFLRTAPSGQVVVIAAGSDPLTVLLAAEFPEVACFELDHPATQRLKQAALKELKDRKGPALIAVDLTRRSVRDVLANTGFSPERPTLFIAEGITMYLRDAEIETFFEQIRLSTRHNGSHFLFTYMNRQPSGSIQFESATLLVDPWLRLKGEVFRWGIETARLRDFLAERGFILAEICDAGDLARRYPAARTDHAPARGENICLTRMA